MHISDRHVIGCSQKWLGGHFGGRVPDISYKRNDGRESGIFWGVCLAILGL